MNPAPSPAGPPVRRRRGWLRPGPRALVELLALVLAVLGYEALRHRGEFPRPTARALRSGNAADRADALRALSRFGTAGVEAIPALATTLRNDPDPALRRGAAFALAAVAGGDGPPEPFPIELLLYGSEHVITTPADAVRPPNPPHPRASDAASVLVDALRADPDPTVRLETIRSLTLLLRSATGTRPPLRGGYPLGPNPDPPPEPRPAPEIPRWAFDAARALADLAVPDGEPDAASQAALGWVFMDPASPVLLDDASRFAPLLSSAARAIRDGQPDALDRMIVMAAATEARGSAHRSDAFFALILPAMAGPPPEAYGAVPLEALAHPFWLALPSARRLREHPEAVDAFLRLLVMDPGSNPYTQGVATDRPDLSERLQRFIHREAETDGLPGAHPAPIALAAIREDPAILDILGPRAQEPHWSAILIGVVDQQGWDAFAKLLDDPEPRTGLSPDRAVDAANYLLDAVAELPDQLAYPRRLGLALASYFLKAVPPDSPSIARHAELLDALSDASEPEPNANPVIFPEGTINGVSASEPAPGNSPR
ncbi:hypothetical protein [Tautonia plasticadhaerens]|uniref:HEAT repeat protein n=1 Tax=Tautonia plasticadhaerens TaxID=2527974 RepID=A0A518HBX9_9BACT|nr:hypothetical protein [Tautonia plasticadhaerens]QDV38355.1 hypothetical protein ElP_63070 [Tautonia plasticadhaerens]